MKTYGPLYDKAPYDPARCIEIVLIRGLKFPRLAQCRRKKGYGPNEEYCATHNPDKVQARRQAKYDKFARKDKIAHLKHTIDVKAAKVMDSVPNALTLFSKDSQHDPRYTELLEAYKDYLNAKRELMDFHPYSS